MFTYTHPHNLTMPHSKCPRPLPHQGCTTHSVKHNVNVIGPADVAADSQLATVHDNVVLVAIEALGFSLQLFK